MAAKPARKRDTPIGLAAAANSLADRLKAANKRVVFAESCTAGLVSASLARVPGISAYHCGSAVTYREETKQRWLGVAHKDIQRHTAVSRPVARQMAEGVLAKTPEADFAAAVTGHLGPDSPPRLDGIVFIAVAKRSASNVTVGVERFELIESTRLGRQREAAALVLQCLADKIG